jgi:Zn-finger nucleic acid-binding protein
VLVALGPIQALERIERARRRSVKEVNVKCPKCHAAMEKVTHGTIEVDRCTECKGLWFDLLERENLAQLEGSEQIDTGNPETGEAFDRVERIDCPVCSTLMIRMVDPVQPHIRYEACKSCNGVFLDAGEFTDIKERTLLDRLRDLFAPERE